MNLLDKLGLGAIGALAALPLILGVVVVIGWIMNIFDVLAITRPLNVEDALHLIGIVLAPLGAIMGIFF